VFLNDQNISYALYGDVPHDCAVLGLNDRGDLLWRGNIRGVEGSMTLYLNQTNISAIAGPDSFVYNWREVTKLDQHGRVAWMDRGLLDAWPERVWVDDLVLSTDALGPDWRNYGAYLLDMGPNGHVLWMSYDINQMGRVTVWRSTPIPEPSGGAAAVCGLLLLAPLWKRRRR
jgi:hypothetical protein